MKTLLNYSLSYAPKMSILFFFSKKTLVDVLIDRKMFPRQTTMFLEKNQANQI